MGTPDTRAEPHMRSCKPRRQDRRDIAESCEVSLFKPENPDGTVHSKTRAIENNR